MSAADEANLLAYQRRIKSLVAENRRLNVALDKVEDYYKDRVRVLRAELKEGLNPELLALRKELSVWRTRATAAEARLKEATHGAR